MVKAYWLRILLCGIGGLILGYVVALLTPAQYDAVVQVLMPPPEPTVPRADYGAQDVTDMINFPQPRGVTTQVETLTSLGVISTAAQKVAAEKGLPMTQGSELYPVDLQDKINVTAATQSDLVTLRVRASSAELARLLAGYMYEAFNDENKRSSTEFANRAIESLERQIGDIDKQMKSIDAEIEKVRTESGMPDLNSQTQAAILLERDLEQSSDAAKQDLASSTARVAALQAEIRNFPDESRGQAVTTADPMYQAIERDLRSAEADREQLMQRYLPENEFVQAQDKKIAELKKQLKSYKPKSETSSVKQPNPNRLSLLADLSSARAAAASAAERVRVADEQLTAKRASRASWPALQTRLFDLARQQDSQQRLQAQYRDRLTSLKAAGVGRVNMSQLVTPAQASERPVIPNTNLNLSLGLVIGIAAGFLWALSTESKRNPVRSLGQLNRLSLQPSYRAIPEFRSPMPLPNRAPAEIFDAMLVNFIRSEKKGYRLGVVGVSRGSGASTTAANMALAAARSGYKVVYVESEGAAGVLAKYLAGNVPKEVAESIAMVTLAPGSSSVMSAELEAAAANRDLVIYDFAPARVSGDAFLYANQLDETVLLVRANVTRSVDFLQAQQGLLDSGCPLVTVAMSRVTEQPDDIVALEQQTTIRPLPSDA